MQDEFDKIVDQVNGLEMEALKQGNGFVPKEEITPAEAASDITFAVDPNLVAKATADLATTKSDLPLVSNEYVAAFINFFAYTQKGHNTLLHSFERSGRYKPMIQRVLAEEGVPQDLIYLAVAESGFQPQAVNRKSRAGGMWQFMPGPYYGLTRNAYVDERFDPEKSTRAYARYMKFLYDELGDWYLAMAAYDHGAGNMQHAVQRTGYADFWELYKRGELPKETANYVPEILAAIIIANHPQQYGFDDVTLDPPVLTDTVTIDYSIDLRLVSDLVGAPVDEIEALNPSLLRMVTPPDASFDLHLPAGTATLFAQRAALIPEARRNSWRYHPVAAGDTLASVAQEYRVPVAELASANQLTAEPKSCGYRRPGGSCAPCRRAPGAHPALHRPPRRYPGHHRRPLRRLLEPAAPLEQHSLRHPGGSRPPPARGRARACPHLLDPSPQGLQQRQSGASQRPRITPPVPRPNRPIPRPRRPPPTPPAARPTSPRTPPSLRNSKKNCRKSPFPACVFLVFMCKLKLQSLAQARWLHLLCENANEIMSSGNPLEAMGWMKCSGCTQ